MTLVAYTKIRPYADTEELWTRAKNAFPHTENDEYFRSIKSRKNQDSIKESLCALLVLAELLKNANFKSESLIFARQESGKPYFSNSKIEFSLSHSGEYSVAAICDNSGIGIDIETSEISNEKAEKLAKRFFSEAEIKEVQTTPESFLMIWTKKEAFAKMHGIPLSNLIANEKRSPLKTRENVFCEVFKIDNNPLAVCLDNPCEIKNLGEIAI